MPASRAAELLDRIYATGKVEAADGARLDAFPCGMSRRQVTEIERLVREERFTRTIETGLGYGLSTLAICGVHEWRGEGSHIAIDPRQSERWRSIGLLNARRAAVDGRLTFVEARSDEALPRLHDEGLEVDFALIDGRHVFDAVLVDFYYLDRMLRVGGVVVFHDTWLPAIAQVVAYVRRNRAYAPVKLRDPAMVALRKTGEDDRRWTFHRGFALDPRGRATVLLARGARLVRRLR